MAHPNLVAIQLVFVNQSINLWLHFLIIWSTALALVYIHIFACSSIKDQVSRTNVAYLSPSQSLNNWITFLATAPMFDTSGTILSGLFSYLSLSLQMATSHQQQSNQKKKGKLYLHLILAFKGSKQYNNINSHSLSFIHKAQSKAQVPYSCHQSLCVLRDECIRQQNPKRRHCYSDMKIDQRREN